MNRHFLYLILVVLLGFVLRLIGAMNLSVGADEMHFVTHAINFLSADKLITYDQSCGLWFAFTDLMFRLFGEGHMASRIGSVVFGTISIPLTYLLIKEFCDKRIALTGALILAVAPFHILSTVAEMDVIAMCFTIGSMLLFIQGLKTGRLWRYIASGMLLGLGVYMKVYPILFLPSLLLYLVYSHVKQRKRVFSRGNILAVSLLVFTVFLFCIPSLTYNYLLYKDKGFVDVQFTRAFGLGVEKSSKYYTWKSKHDWAGLVVVNKEKGRNSTRLGKVTKYFRLKSPFVFYLGILGFVFLVVFRRKHIDCLVFLFLCHLIIVPYMGSLPIFPKHYLFLEMLVVPLAALAVCEIGGYLNKKVKINALPAVSLLLVLAVLVLLGLPKIDGFYSPHRQTFYGKGEVPQMFDFKHSIRSPNTLVVADTRIYRGRIHWVFDGMPYLEGKDFVPIFNRRDELKGRKIPVDVYYFECAKDDCGWGRHRIPKVGHAYMEALTDFFKKNGRLVKRIRKPPYDEAFFPFSTNRETAINVYSVGIKMKDSLVSIARKPKTWFLYTIGYGPPGSQFDDYRCSNVFDKALNGFAHLIVLLALILMLLTPVFVFYLVYDDAKGARED